MTFVAGMFFFSLSDSSRCHLSSIALTFNTLLLRKEMLSYFLGVIYMITDNFAVTFFSVSAFISQPFTYRNAIHCPYILTQCTLDKTGVYSILFKCDIIFLYFIFYSFDWIYCSCLCKTSYDQGLQTLYLWPCLSQNKVIQ